MHKFINSKCYFDTGEEVVEIAVDNAIFHHGNQFAKHLADGLADNWSQVRLASSVAARKFLLGLPEATRHTYYPVLIPPLCLNR